MNKELFYYSSDGSYWTPDGSIYAQLVGDFPNPCCKYHISSDVQSAEKIAETILPFLVERRIYHKVVKTKFLLGMQMLGKQAGKFITFYLDVQAENNEDIVREIGGKLSLIKTEYEIQPGPKTPKSRADQHEVDEEVVDEGRFIYGGFITDPTK